MTTMLTIKEDKYWKYLEWDNYKKWDEVLQLSWQMLLFPTRESIQVWDYHVHDELWQYINHSFTPTCAIVWQSVIALVDILDKEITFNYTKNESTISAPFVDMWTGKPVWDININSINVVDPIIYTPDWIEEGSVPSY